MKKILVFNWRCINHPLAGGAEKVTLKHCAFWVQNGYQVFLLTGGHKGSIEKEIIEGVKILHYGNPFTVYLLASLIYWLRFKGRVDVVIDQFHGFPFFSPLWARNSQIIAFIHETAQDIWDLSLPPPLNMVAKLLESFSFKLYRNTPFWTVSQSTKKDLLNLGIQKKMIKVIPNGVDLLDKKPPHQKKGGLRIIILSRLVPLKRIEEGIKIFAKIKNLQSTAKLYIVGQGDKKYTLFLKKLVRNLKLKNSVEFTGYLLEKEKNLLLQKSHFLLHTSLKEGFGLSILEANSYGTPAIVYNSPGLNEIVKNGINGFVFSEKKKDKIIQKILELYSQKGEYKKLSLSAFNFAKKFPWKKSLNLSLRLLRKTV